MSDANPAKFKKLVTLLRELFQLDQPDLDFGIYRIMHAKAGEVTDFLERDLLPQVKDAFASYQSADSAELQKKLDQMIAQLNEAGVDPEQSPKVRELREQLKSAVDIGGLENETYDHLFSFFRRYYSEGDFLAKRVYKPGVYAIPYEGEEVTLHWANKDQYYIKTSEYLRDYAFRLRPEADEAKGESPLRVHFKLVDASEGEHGNVKATEGGNRVFVLADDDFIAEDEGELSLRFEYRPASVQDWPEEQRDGQKKPPTQANLIDIAEARIAASDAALRDWLAALAQPHIKADGETADYSRLKAHLRRYSARNTFDYFIHKDLGGFLRRELDFYIKNEVMHLDDVESETAPKVEQYLSKIKVIRRIGGKIIDFLAQLENFQKKLWLKKKFVTETTWLVALSQVPDELLAEIAGNDAQREEWIALHAIDELAADTVTPGYSVPLTEAFLKAHPTLMVDTRRFDADFSSRLLAAFADADARTDGLLMHGENSQALALIQRARTRTVECIYIDPPYNTELDRATGRFVYKDNYEHSSWMSMMSDRLELDAQLLTATGAHFISSDESELHRLTSLAERFGRKVHGYFTWRRTRTGGHLSRAFNQLSDYVLVSTAHAGQFLYGGMADPEESQPLTKGGNNVGRLRFSAGELGFLDTKFADVETGYIGESATALMVVESFSVRDFVNTTDVLLEGPFVWTQKKLTQELSAGARVIVKKLSGFNPRFLRTPTIHKPFPSLADGAFDVGTNEDGSSTLKELFGESEEFSYPKPVKLIQRIVQSKAHFDKLITTLDYFAGSGTTGHAVINLNRNDGGSRKFILVEQGGYFDTVLVPRLKKIGFTPNWKDGKPGRMATPDEAERSPRLIKVLRLESYEDTLNNLELRRSVAQQGALEFPAASGADALREQYLLRYQLDVESRGSQSLLNVAAFTDPTAYRLKVKTPGSDESREVNVDLLETFNWLIGLTVQHIAAPRSFSASFTRDAEQRMLIDGRIKQAADGPWWFRTVTGTTPEGRSTLIIWRKLTGDAEQDNLMLETWFKDKQAYSVRDAEFDLIYVNGDNTLENLRLPDETWKVRVIEEDFQRLMFEGTES